MSRSFHSGVISVPGPSTSRPELHPHDHEYTFMERNETEDHLAHNLEICKNAVDVIHEFEEFLVQSVVEKDSSYLLKLEKVLLDLAASEGVTSGVYYHLAFQKSGVKIARFFESGCYEGALENLFLEDELQGQHAYGIYAKEDVKERAKHIESRGKSIGEKRSRGGKGKGKNRTGQRYKQLIEGSEGALTQLLQNLLLKIKQSDLSIQSLVISVLRENASSDKANDRYLYVFGHEKELTSNKLHQHTIDGQRPKYLDIRARKESMPLNEQFEFISQVPNFHWIVPGVKYLQSLCTKNDGYLPTSIRNRYIHFITEGEIENAREALDGKRSLKSSLNRDSSAPKRKRLDCTPMMQMTTSELLMEVGETEAPDVSSMYHTLSMYEEYVRRLVESGCISWRLASSTDYIVAMNSYSPTTGAFLPCDFVHVNFGTVVTGCSCPSYKDMTVSDSKCMHVRFVEKELIPRLDLLIKQDWRPNTPMETLLHSHIGDHLEAISVLGQSSIEKTVKFSVRGRTGSMGFVNLSKNGQYIACQSGSCTHSMGSRKSVQKLRELNEVSSLCPHLDTMHAHHEVWEAMMLNPMKQKNEDSPQVFNVETGMWDFGGLSKHQPKAEKSPELRCKVMERMTINDLSYKRDENGYFVGFSLKPPFTPCLCACGAGFAETDHIDGVNIEAQFNGQVTFYMRHGAARCWVHQRRCKSGQCTAQYTGEEDGIYFWSNETAIAVEVLYDFERQLFSRTSFSGFCEQMTQVYLSGSPSDGLKFMSSSTFINCFFGWMSSKKIDFRQSIDPWCMYNPKFLACDGTHVGVAIKKIDMVPIENPDVAGVRSASHTRYNRVFLPYVDGRNDNCVRQARLHLKYLADRYLKNSPAKSRDDEEMGTKNLLDVCPNASRQILDLFANDPLDIEINLLQALSKLMKLLGSDAAVEAILPFGSIIEINDIFETFQNIEDLKVLSCIEVYEVVIAAKDSVHKLLVQSFLNSLTESIRKIHDLDRESDTPVSINGSYDPSKGLAYYFTPSGEQVRRLPTYALNKKSSDIFDDAPVDACSKVFPSVGTGGFSHVFLWFCPIHGHSYGFHLIPAAEGRKDPFTSLLKYLPSPPKHVFYDFACSLSEYCLNREPFYFKNVRFWHDIFHSLTHVCGDSFKSTRVKDLNVNSEICEQFNAYLQSIKYTATHLSQAKFCFLLQYTLHKWNEKCTRYCEKRIEVSEESRK